MAPQLAFLELDEAIGRLTANAILINEEARRLARIGLASYFAGALVQPYGAFLAAVESERYDIERLGEIFGVGFETICHRLSTLQRPGVRGVSFFFVHVDRAGNISKRQSATDFYFSRVGGTCPLWKVYEAFAQPERVLRPTRAAQSFHEHFEQSRTNEGELAVQSGVRSGGVSVFAEGCTACRSCSACACPPSIRTEVGCEAM